MKVRQKIEILSLAKLQALLLSLVGLVFGILYSIGGLLLDTLVSIGWITSTTTTGLGLGSILALGALIGVPVLFGIIGFLLGLAEAVLYNLFSGYLGYFFPKMKIGLKK